MERIGVKREEVLSESELRGSLHPVPETAASHGCGWPAAHSFTVPESWRSGFYEVTLSVEDGGGTFTHRGKRTAESVLSFVVRAAAPGSASKVLLQLSTNSYAAYNNWGGFSVYGYHGINGVQGHRASFERPMGTGLYYSWEHFFVVWAEGNGETAFATHTHTHTPPTPHTPPSPPKLFVFTTTRHRPSATLLPPALNSALTLARAGYTLDYAVNSDLEDHPELLQSYKLVLSVGHDEYWSSGMRDSLEAWIAEGGHVAFFSGNTCCWQTRTEDEGRAFTCWKQWYNMDPAHQGSGSGEGFGAGSEFPTPEPKMISTLWSHHLVGRPENQLTGVGFLWGGYHRSHGQLMDGSGAFTVHRPEHWVFAGCGIEEGDSFGANHVSAHFSFFLDMPAVCPHGRCVVSTTHARTLVCSLPASPGRRSWATSATAASSCLAPMAAPSLPTATAHPTTLKSSGAARLVGHRYSARSLLGSGLRKRFSKARADRATPGGMTSGTRTGSARPPWACMSPLAAAPSSPPPAQTGHMDWPGRSATRKIVMLSRIACCPSR